ncbi:hypothetical protein PABG_02944 [Paracoccidioides brasiliensis Pb03]|nr:hypothetical protein PABG_02944 [Paracoccidioides brasiliensis Pb03]
MISRSVRYVYTLSHSGAISVYRPRPRYFSMANVSKTSTVQPKYASSTPEELSQLAADTKSLLGSNWTLDGEKMGVTKTFYFKTYTKCQDFFNLVAIKSKSENHHSTMTVKFRSVDIHWTTHNPPGLSSKDTLMAKYCDEQANILGAVDVSQVQTCSSPPSPKS